MIAVDSSALIAIAGQEAEAPDLLGVLTEVGGAVLSPINYVETGIILVRRGYIPTQRQFDGWLDALNVAVDEETPLRATALEAYLRFGKGIHPARLNLADCFAYALAKQLDAPLLYKGDDFAKTDIRSALQPT